MPKLERYTVAVVVAVVVTADDGTREEFKVDSFDRASSDEVGGRPLVGVTAAVLQKAALKAMEHAEAVKRNEDRRLA